MRQRIGIAVLGLGWMGQAHSRSAARIPSLFPDRAFDPELVEIFFALLDRLRDLRAAHPD